MLSSTDSLAIIVIKNVDLDTEVIEYNFERPLLKTECFPWRVEGISEFRVKP
jgi:hypothetical protein